MSFMLNLGIDGKEAVKIEKKGAPQIRGTPLYVNISVILFLALLAWSPGLQLLEEVVALVVYEDECREVLYGNLPDSLHAELWVLYALDALDGTLRENGSYTTDSTEVETTMLLAGLCHDVATVALGNHDQAGAMILELVNVWVHSVGCGRTHRATWITLWSLGRTSIEDRVVLEVLWHLLASIQASLELGMSDVTSHDDGTLQVDTGADRILAQLGTYGVDTLVEVDFDTLGTLSWVAELLRNQLCWVLVHLLQPDTVLVDLSLDVAVGRAAYTHTDRAAGTMTGQTDDTDVVSQVLTTKLCTQANLVSLIEELVLQVDVAESTAGLITCCRQLIIVLDRSQLHGKEVLLGRSTTDNECDVVRRTCCCAEALHLLYEEWEEGAFVLDSSFGHRVEVGLVGRTATLGNHHEAILVALGCLDIDLGRQVATGIYLIIHIERSIL